MEVPGSYPKRMVFSIFGEDRIKQFNLHQGEQNITVQFDIDAHEFNGRWFNEVRAYNVIRPYMQAPVAAAPQQAVPAAPFPPQQPAPQGNGDLPF